VLIENIPKICVRPTGGIVITAIRLFYYGQPSEQEYQYLTPAWGFRVNGRRWVYVDAFTGEFLE